MDLNIGDLPAGIQTLVSVCVFIVTITVCTSSGVAAYFYKRRSEPDEIAVLQGVLVGVVVLGASIIVVPPLLDMPYRWSIFSTEAVSMEFVAVFVIVMIGIVWLLLYLKMKQYQKLAVTNAAATQVAQATTKREEDFNLFIGALTIPNNLRFGALLVFQTFYDHYITKQPVDPLFYAKQVNEVARVLPNAELVTFDESPDGKEWGKYALQWMEANKYEDHLITGPIGAMQELWDGIRRITIKLVIPERIRTEHHQIIANPGHGKTSCLQNMILDDLNTGAAIIVIDSQGDMINKLALHIPISRLVLIDPETCPPALNIFATDVKGEKSIATAIELYEYIFSALDSQLTGMQSLVYRYLSRLCMTIPGATINTMRDMLRQGGTEPYQPYIDKLSSNAQTFFAEFQLAKGNQFLETKQQVLRRLLTVLESETFSRMLGASTMRFKMADAIEKGKVVLISTNKNMLKSGSALLGRIFLAQVMQAVTDKPEGERRRTYLYIDEFADYAEDSSILLDLFSQGRKYELGMIVCHQNLTQLPLKLAATLSSSTAIKFVGGVSAQDSGALASQMRTTRELIDAQRKGTFLAYFKDLGVLPWRVDLGRLERLPRPPVQTLRNIQTLMRSRYGEEPTLEQELERVAVANVLPEPPEEPEIIF